MWVSDAVVLLPLLGMVNHSTDPDAFLVRVRVAFIVQALVVDFLLTFVMPALVFTTANTVTALRIGVRYLRRTWPTTKWQVLVPPTAIIAIGQAASGRRGGLLLGAAISLSGAMLGLLFKGAQLRAYFAHAAELGIPIGEPGGALPPKPASSNETILSMRQRRAEAAREHRARSGDG